ncbi:hypothetical protein [Rhodococcus sp. NKCM2511]|uniref:hypothetical protein n=1 Tax=Rhodococcus sp. NKCM2511 TaxID=2766011 RepID=UPI00190FD1BE|nr:hypothetical protein [Rhodococcus sp. NKCM2511]
MITKLNIKWLISEVGWYIAEGGAGIAATYVPFDCDYWSGKRLQRRTDRAFDVLVHALDVRP